MQPIECFADGDPAGIAHCADRLDAARACKSFRAHHARREAATFLIHPGDDDQITPRRFVLLRERDHRLKRGHDTCRAIELSAGRLAVEMTADENGWRHAI